MIEEIATAATSDLTVGFFVGAAIAWGINSYRLHKERYDHMNTLANAVVISVHADAFSQVLDEEGIDPDRAEEKIQEWLEYEHVVEAFHQAGLL